MIEFLTNYAGSIAVGLIILGIIALIILKGVKDKRAGKTVCGGDCAHCGQCQYSQGSDKNSRRNSKDPYQ